MNSRLLLICKNNPTTETIRPNLLQRLMIFKSKNSNSFNCSCCQPPSKNSPNLVITKYHHHSYSPNSTSSCAAISTNSDFEISKSFGFPPFNLRFAELNQIASPHGVLRSLNSESINLTTLRGRIFSSRT